MTPIRAVLTWIAIPVLALALSACEQTELPRDRTPSTSAAQAGPSAQAAPSTHTRGERGPVRDLAIDESMGGHTLSRHVGKTDAELGERLRREPRISAASTYNDRATAERSVGSALASGADKLGAWERRSGRRPNLVLNYRSPGKEPLGRSLRRGQKRATPATRALVVLRWDERARRFYVLTSHPEADR
jgi:hypothetical protein